MRLPATMNIPGWHWVAHVSAPSVWGHLPGGANTIAFQTCVGEARAWQHWWIDQTRPHPHALTRARKRRPPHGMEPHWIHLEPPARSPERTWQPVAFILPPGSLPLATDHFLVGAVICWHDSQGQRQPLVVYQLSNRRWLELHLRPFGSPGSNPVQAWLYALCTLLSCYQPDAAWPQPPRALPQAVLDLWRLFAPGWLQWHGMPQNTPTRHAMQAALGLCTHLGDAAPALQDQVLSIGLPWDDWPQCLWSTAPRTAFWQHDPQGTCLATGADLKHLWPH